MKDLLKALSISSIQLGDFTYSNQQINSEWLRSDATATTEDIQYTESRLGVKFPDDYKKFLLITNGFAATNNVEPEFEPIEKVNYLKNLDVFWLAFGNRTAQ